MNANMEAASENTGPLTNERDEFKRLEKFIDDRMGPDMTESTFAALSKFIAAAATPADQPSTEEKVGTPPISEAASEKPKRGRPSVFTPEHMKDLREGFPGLTQRQLLERAYAYKVFGLIAFHPDCRHIITTEEELRNGGGFIHWEVLAQLGRMRVEGWSDKHILRAAAMAKDKTSKVAVQIIRRARRSAKAGGEKPPQQNQDKLIDDLITTVCRHVEVYRGTSVEDIRRALNVVCDSLKSTWEPEGQA